jgi:hypothetical protein
MANLTRHLPASSIVPQPTMLPGAPYLLLYGSEILCVMEFKKYTNLSLRPYLMQNNMTARNIYLTAVTME